MLEGIVGPPAIGINFFDRKTELEAIWRALKHSSVLLISPRRFGKTSITSQLKHAPKPGWDIHYTDIEALSDPVDFVMEILALVSGSGLSARLRDVFTTLRNTVEEIQIVDVKIQLKQELRQDWQSKGNKIFEHLEKDRKTVFVLDEL